MAFILPEAGLLGTISDRGTVLSMQSDFNGGPTALAFRRRDNDRDCIYVAPCGGFMNLLNDMEFTETSSNCPSWSWSVR
ncbi:predicted protein [Sclerotinia sclerotiorum 1980 UF-70]|uniref:Uncharacterized protein n=1 Tax=Sclerotinia sclerotiorum (strain ATCC 18683 / 1980 / Ss-1) TaxID=665079 RepID=A7EGV0_SCLS1|nr:predicted protein [Sclerotinia sclerotiorum 1980 UF-70]EDO02066.1 predicted protein [Sclerotinia sclerotiorum 1980 UF-70]